MKYQGRETTEKLKLLKNKKITGNHETFMLPSVHMIFFFQVLLLSFGLLFVSPALHLVKLWNHLEENFVSQNVEKMTHYEIKLPQTKIVELL